MAHTLWFTGLSGSGKTTIMNALQEFQKDYIILDGDVIRKYINYDLGFTTEDRIINVKKTAGLAKILNDQGFNVLVGLISPFEKDRDLAKELIGNCHIIYVKASIDICKERDVKGLYKKAMKGEIPNFTGVSSPYEIPINHNLIVDTSIMNVENAAITILEYVKFTKNGTKTNN